MRDEQQTMRPRRFFAEATIVKRGEHGLARAGRSDNEIFLIVMQETFTHHIVEHLALVDKWVNVEEKGG